jgi:pimeloyl-ACP methyl ester carboxylesterase
MWEGQLALAAGGWRVIAPEYPTAASVDDYAGAIVDLLDGLHIHDAVIGGLSLGGYVAFALFRLAPNYVRGLVLADTRAEADTPESVDARKRMIGLLHEHGAGGVASEMLPKLLGAGSLTTRPDLVDMVRRTIMGIAPEKIEGMIEALMTRPDSTELLGKIRVPTLIVVGHGDIATPPPLSTKMRDGIRGAELVLLASAGHLSNLEQPAAFNGALANFLETRL